MRAEWIVDVDSALGEVPVDFSQRGHGVNHGVRHGMAKALIVHEEEGLGVRDGPAERSTKVVLHQVVVAHGIEGGGVERAIAQELVGGAVELVGAGTSHDVDLSAARSAHLGGIASGLYLELLHCIRGRTKVEGVERRVCIGGAVEQKIVRIRPVAADTYRGALSRPPIQRVHVAGLGAVTFVCARNREHQVDQHSAVERKFLDGNWFDHFAYGSVSGVQHRDLAGNFHDVFGSCHTEREIQRHLLANFELQGSGQCGKARCLHREFVLAGQQGGNLKHSLLVSVDTTLGPRAYGRDLYGRAGERSPLGVEHGATQNRVVALGEGLKGKQQEAEKNHSMQSRTPTGKVKATCPSSLCDGRLRRNLEVRAHPEQ